MIFWNYVSHVLSMFYARESATLISMIKKQP